jgi:hypothetical protein
MFNIITEDGKSLQTSNGIPIECNTGLDNIETDWLDQYPDIMLLYVIRYPRFPYYIKLYAAKRLIDIIESQNSQIAYQKQHIGIDTPLDQPTTNNLLTMLLNEEPELSSFFDGF